LLKVRHRISGIYFIKVCKGQAIYMNSLKKPKSIQEQIRESQQNSFIGREAEIESFRLNLKRHIDKSYNSGNYYILFSIWGQDFVGKTSLMNRFREIAEQAKFISVYTDGSEDSVLKVMGRFAENLEKQGKKLDRFSKKYKFYLQKKGELEFDPQAPKGFGVFLGKMAVKASLELAKQVVPGIGLATPLLDEEAIASQFSEYAAYLIKKTKNHDERLLLKNPLEILTKLFLDDLNRVAKTTKIVLLFDQYEKTGVFLDDWLREFLLNLDDNLINNLIFVIAGREELDRSDWSSYKEVINRMQLKPFRKDEVKQYLEKKSIYDAQNVDEIFRISNGLPFWVVNLSPENPSDSIISNNTVVEYFLKRINDPKKEKIALEASLSPLINQDIIAVILDDKESADELFNWLKSMPFVEESFDCDWSYRYQNSIRTQMLNMQRRKSLNRWMEIHGKLANYYEAECSRLQINSNQRWNNSGWQGYFFYGVYHLLCHNPSQGLTKALSAFLNALDRQFLSESAQKCAEIIASAGKVSAIPTIESLGEKLLEGLKSFNENRYEDGISMFTLLLTQYNHELEVESKAIALSWRGEAYRLMGLQEKSLSDFNDAISINPNDSWMLVSRSSTYRKMRNYQKSLEDCNRAIEIDSKDIRAFTSRGETNLRLKNYNEALQDFNHAIELDPDDAWSISSRGKAYQQMRRYEEAIKDYDLAIKLNPSDVWTLSNRGFIYRKQGEYDKALDDYNLAIEIDPNNARSFASRGETYRLIRQHGEALKDFNNAVVLKPNDGWALCRRAETYLLLRDYENSLSDFAAVIALTPDNHWRLFTYSLTFRAYGNLEEASKKISMAIQIARVQYEKNLADNRTALTLALYYLSNDDIKEAELLYESVLSKNVQLELVKEAIQALDDFLEIFPYHSFSKSIRKKLVSIVKK